MDKIKCDYCGKEIIAEYMSTLENGSPACPQCVEEEQNKQKRYSQRRLENAGKDIN